MRMTSRQRIRGWAAGAVVFWQVFGSVSLLSASDVEVRSSGQSVYVPVYSHIFIGDRPATFSLAATLSIRNIDPHHTIYLTAADYHDAAGRLVKKHIEKQVVLGPLASTEAFIAESDTSGGLGSSFVVRWKSDRPVVAPIVECIMIGTRSGQGISFVSHGRVIQEDKK
jgi:hypothetical protein